MKRYLLFDLDGTLTDPKVGITTCVQYALADFGIEEPDLDKLEPFIGPPLKDSFMEFYHMTEEQADRAIEKYRERFRDIGIFENEVYGGIYDLLRTMKSAGMHMAVVSSKPTVFVERILKHFKLDPYFEIVLGSELDGSRVKKAQVIAETLRKLFGDEPVKTDEIYMIGDRKFDMEGARTFHIESIGVTYGYGSMEELKEARADYIVTSVAELKKLLMREVDEIKRMENVHQAQQPGGKRPQSQGMKDFWRVVLPYLMFLLMKTAVSILLTILYRYIAASAGAEDTFFIVEGEDNVSLTGFAGILSQIVSVAAAGLIVSRYARINIRKAAEEMHLTHLKPEPVKNYVILGITTVCGVVGILVGMNMVGLVDLSASYLFVKDTPYEVPVLPALISYGLCTPIVEELVFRGIIYNGVKRFMTPKVALLMTTLFFAYNSGYGVLMIYGIALGLLTAYAYEYFGQFRVAVGVHIAANLVFYLLCYTAVTQTPVFSWPVCIAGIVLAAAGVYLLMRQKKVY